MFFLQLRNELWKLFGKKRTYIGFGMVLLAQSIIGLVFRFHKGPSRQLIRAMEGNGYPAEQYLSYLTVATAMLIPIAYLLLALYVSLVGGDLVAKEAEEGTLRMILSRPISRARLLLLKWLAGVVFSFVLVFALGLFGLLFARLLFPPGGLFVFIPWDGIFGVFDGASGWERYVAAHFFLAIKACTIMSLAFMFSCLDVKPAAATILAISFVFLSVILQDMPYFRDLRQWFMTYHLNFWGNFFHPVIPWWRVAESLSILAGFNLTFLVIGCTAFQLRDFKS